MGNFLTSKFQILERFDPAACSSPVYSLQSGKADPWRWQYQGPVNKSTYSLRNVQKVTHHPLGYKTLCSSNIIRLVSFSGYQNVIFCTREETDLVTNDYLSFDDIFGKEINGRQESFKPGIANNWEITNNEL